MRFLVKEPGAWTWKMITTDSLEAEVASGRVRGDWLIRLEGQSEQSTVDQLVQALKAAPPETTQAKSDNVPKVGKEKGINERVMLVLPAVVLVIRFFNGLMPVTESPSPALNALGIVMELLAVVGLIGMGVRVLRSQTSGRGVWIFVLLVGIAAALGIFVIRLTGGRHVELPPRSSAASVELEGLPKQLHELIVSSSKLGEKLAATRWGQTAQKGNRETNFCLCKKEAAFGRAPDAGRSGE